MEKETKRLEVLLEKWFVRQITVGEEQELLALVKQEEHKTILAATMERLWDSFPNNDYHEQASDSLLADTILQNHPVEKTAFLPQVKRINFLRTVWFRYAAVLMLAIATGAYLWIKNMSEQSTLTGNKDGQNNIAPGSSGAILTLADGSQVVLDSLGDGLVATQNGAQVIVENGQIAYTPSGKVDAEIVYNTLSTPKGRQYPFTLPDSTKVWLNAASSIRYPTVFTGKERRVTITGEVYFEVAKNATAPFHVNVRNGASVTVLGTQFNVNAYENEKSINATLIEGSIRVAAPAPALVHRGEQVVLLPGQQAQIVPTAATGSIKVIAATDIEKVLAWKNGLFDFNGLAFEEIMRQLERWYDIQVVYENNQVPNKRLVGKMTRGVPLHGFLRNLEELGVHYKLQNRTLIISP